MNNWSATASLSADNGLADAHSANFYETTRELLPLTKTTASVEMKWLNGWSAAATFEGEFSNLTSSYAGKGVVRYAW